MYTDFYSLDITKGEEKSFKSSILKLSVDGTVAIFIIPDWGDKVDSGIGLSYRAVLFTNISFKDDITVIHLLDVSFMDVILCPSKECMVAPPHPRPPCPFQGKNSYVHCTIDPVGREVCGCR